MAITINGSGTVTGITAGGLPDGVITTDDLAANVASGLCKAWVNFNGSGTVAIRDSYNVSSITDNGTGDYTVNFTTAMPDANYSIVAGGGSDTGDSTSYVTSAPSTVAPTVSAVRMVTYQSHTLTKVDMPCVNVAIFR